MGYLKRVFCILIIFSLLSTLLSCEKEEVKNIKPQSRVFYEYFDTVGTFSDYNGTSDKTFEALADKVEAMLSEYHKPCYAKPHCGRGCAKGRQKNH